MEQVLCVVGPTACGKTTLSIALAKQYNGEVVSMDSMQIYRGMTIGTAAPRPEETDGIPHHMVGIADPAENWSVARFAGEAVRCVDGILRRDKLPILTGGSGLYLDAVIAGHGFAPSGGPVREQLQNELAHSGIAPLLDELRKVDPESAAKLHPADEKRILRALEVYRQTGKTISQHNGETRFLPKRYRPVYIGLTFRDRADLREQINRRVDQMLEDGLLQEVRALLDSGVPRDATAMQAIGYKEFLAALDGLCTPEEAAEEVRLRSRQYAKRQLTWLRRNPAIHLLLWEKNRDFARALQEATEILITYGIQ